MCLSLVGSAALVVADARSPPLRRQVRPRPLRDAVRAPRARHKGRDAARSMVNVQEYPANPNDVIQAMPGFQIEVVAKADRLKQGSSISMAEDDQGRIILARMNSNRLLD